MKNIEYEFGTLSVGDNFIVGEMHEGIDVNFDLVTEVIRVANAHFNGQKWGYISNRTHSYSLQPLVHKQAQNFEKNMVSFAIVSNRPNIGIYADLENKIAGNAYDFSFFDNLNDAVSWTKSVIKKNGFQQTEGATADPTQS